MNANAFFQTKPCSAQHQSCFTTLTPCPSRNCDRSPTPGPSPTPLIQQPPTRTPRPTATPGGPTLTPTPNPNPALTGGQVRSAACWGAGLTGLVFVLLATYTALRKHARAEIQRWWRDLRREIADRSRSDT